MNILVLVFTVLTTYNCGFTCHETSKNTRRKGLDKGTLFISHYTISSWSRFNQHPTKVYIQGSYHLTFLNWLVCLEKCTCIQLKRKQHLKNLYSIIVFFKTDKEWRLLISNVNALKTKGKLFPFFFIFCKDRWSQSKQCEK